MTAAQFPVDGFFEAFVSLPDMGKAFGNRVKVHCFIQIFKLRIDAADIMQYGLKYVAEKGYRQVYGMCKQELLPRWQQCGYHEIPGAERIEQNGMVLIPISLDLKENPQAIKMTSHPSLLTALEGHWHEKMQEVRKSSMMKAIFWKLKKIRQEHFNL